MFPNVPLVHIHPLGSTAPAVTSNLAVFDDATMFMSAMGTFDDMVSVDAAIQLSHEILAAFRAIQISARLSLPQRSTSSLFLES